MWDVLSHFISVQLYKKHRPESQRSSSFSPITSAQHLWDLPSAGRKRTAGGIQAGQHEAQRPLSTHKARSHSSQNDSFMGVLQMEEEELFHMINICVFLPLLKTAVSLPGKPFPQISYIQFTFTLMRRLLSTNWLSGCPLIACQASLWRKYLECANDQVKIEATCLDAAFYSHQTPFFKRSQMLQNENCTFLVNTERMIHADRHSLAICHR